MALTRKFLATMGIEPDKIDEIIEAHIETVNGIKAERDELKTTASKADEYKRELDDTKAKLDAADKDGFKAKYESLQTEFDTFKQTVQDKEITSAKDKAYREMLVNAGISEKRLDTVMRVTDLTKVELVDGKLKDAEELTKQAKTEWADFVVSEGKRGAETETPPGTDGEKPPVQIPTIF